MLKNITIHIQCHTDTVGGCLPPESTSSVLNRFLLPERDSTWKGGLCMSLEDLYYVVMIVAAFSCAAFALGYHIGKNTKK